MLMEIIEKEVKDTRRRVVADRVSRSLIKLGEWKIKIIGDDVEITLLFTSPSVYSSSLQPFSHHSPSFQPALEYFYPNL